MSTLFPASESLSPLKPSHPFEVPTLNVIILNILISLTTSLSSTISLIILIFIIFPTSFIRTIFKSSKRIIKTVLNSTTSPGTPIPPQPRSRGKVVLITGASSGIGFSLLEQYGADQDARVLATSSCLWAMRETVEFSLDDICGYNRSPIECIHLDLTDPPWQLVRNIKALDRQFGPITHFYEVSGVTEPNHPTQDDPRLNPTPEELSMSIGQIQSGSTTCVTKMAEIMNARGYGKIYVLSSVTELYIPAERICYASSRSFINTFEPSPTLPPSLIFGFLPLPGGQVDLVTSQFGLIDPDVKNQLHEQLNGMSIPQQQTAAAMARHIKDAVEQGGVPFPLGRIILTLALKALNPICEKIGMQWRYKR